MIQQQKTSCPACGSDRGERVQNLVSTADGEEIRVPSIRCECGKKRGLTEADRF